VLESEVGGARSAVKDCESLFDVGELCQMNLRHVLS
jgi:hypothetical protein